MRAGAVMARRPEGMKPICGQCRQPMDPTTDPPQPMTWDAWRHEDGTRRCAPGDVEAFRHLMALFAR